MGRGISVSYRKKEVITECDIEVKKGRITAIVGSTGSGKSTLLYTLSGIIPNIIAGEMSGKVVVDGKPIRPPPNNITVVFQMPDAQMLGENGWDVVMLNARMSKEDIAKICKEFGILEKMDRVPFSLSFGERQLLAICAGIVHATDYLFLDEPTSALDWKYTRRVYSVLQNMKERFGILVVEHKLDVIKKYADYVYVLDKGKVIKEGKKEILNNLEVRRCLGLE